MTTQPLLDPTAERSPQLRPRLPRPATIRGLTIGLLDISKARGDLFLDQLAIRLEEAGASVRRYTKPTFARVAPDVLKQQIVAECELVIEALAD